jgi:methyl-accepting chemotaxis protein
MNLKLSSLCNRSLNRLVTSLTGVLLAVLLLVISATLWVVNGQKTDGLVINLSGRQRMLSERFAKEVVCEAAFGPAKSGEGTAAPEKKSESTRRLFETTLTALAEGGTTYSDLAMAEPVIVPGTQDAEIRGKLAEVQELWTQTQQAVTALRSEQPGSPAFSARVNEILSLNDRCLTLLNASVKMFQIRSDAKVSRLRWIQYASGALALVVFGLISLYIRRGVVRPLTAALQVAQAVAAGDLTRTCPVTTRHEVGQLSDALNKMCVDLRGMVGRISANSQSLQRSAGDLGKTAVELNTGANETTRQSATVAAAAEEMSVNMANMARSAEQMSGNVKTISTSIDEMTAAIHEVAQSAEEAAAVADNAARLAEEGNARISHLGSAASEIGKVIEVIQDIAEQTNLLALNATIEAARAGEAGKGFAVVASEVKALAAQTAEATEDIRRRIEGIQNSTGEAVTSISEISAEVSKLNQASRTIASAVEQQSATTKQIAVNVSQVADGTNEVSLGIAQTALATQEVTQNISNVDSNVKRTCEDASQTRNASETIANLAEELRSLVGQFAV